MEATINHNTGVKSKVFYTEILLFSFIGFLVYLLDIVSGYVAFLLGVSSEKFNSVYLSLAILGVLAFAVCSYLTCFKSKKR